MARDTIQIHQRKEQRHHAMTLIEVIGVLAVLSVLASIALPTLLKQIDKTTADQEVGTLQSFADAFQKSIRRHRFIPRAAGVTNWATVIAAELGLDVPDVTINPRRNLRCLVIDPALTNSFSLPYTQNNAGSATLPAGARVMLLSSLGRTLTNNITSGFLGSGDFNIIWNTADGIVPSATVFATWGGKGEDLKVQRINLAPLFVRLMLHYYASTEYASYSLDTNFASAATNTAGVVDGYFIQTSVLNLYSGNAGTLDSQQILNRDNSFWYYQNVWRGFMPGYTGVPGGTNQSNAFDFSAIVNGFLSAPTNRGAGAASQQEVVQEFMAYMSNYTEWAASSFPYPSGSYSNAFAAQTRMVDALSRLYVNPPPIQY